jgi:amidase
MELLILLTELKADLNAYLATTPATVKTRTLADVIAFNKATPAEMVWFGQELFEQAEATGGLKDPKYLDALRKARELAGPQGIDRLLREHKVVALVAPTYGPAWTIDLVNGDRSIGADGKGGRVARRAVILRRGVVRADAAVVGILVRAGALVRTPATHRRAGTRHP